MIDEPKRYRGQRGPNKVKKDSMVGVSIRLPAEVVDFYRGSSTAMRAALVKHMERTQAMEELIAHSAEELD